MALKSIAFNGKNFDISYEIVNSSCDKSIVFLHGWGSNKQLMKQAFGSYLKEYKHIYIDMPGFGNSSNEHVLKTIDYKNIIKEFLSKLGVDVISIVGHSFGGKVATLLNPKNLVLLSTAGIIEKKPFDVKLKIFLVKILKSIGLGFTSKLFRSKDVNKMSESMYGTFKNVVDEDFSDKFKNHKQNTLIFWGEKDLATSLSSGKKINTLIENSTLYSYDADHYFFLKFANDICKKIETGIK